MEKKYKEFLEKQQKAAFKEGLSTPFMSDDGLCWSCHQFIIEEELKKGNDGSELVTGCPLCHRSYCD